MSSGDDTAPPAAGCGCQYDVTGQVFTDRCVCPDAAAGPRAGDTAPSSGAHVIQTRGFPDDFVPPSASLDRPARDTAPDDEPPGIDWKQAYDEIVGAAARSRYLGERLDECDAELERLRSEVAALRDAGNALADAAEDVIDGPIDSHLEALFAAASAWRSAAGAAPADETGAER